MVTRCPWSLSNTLQQKYHDTEWGVPVHNDNIHFEFLILEGNQAGLSWDCVLQKRENFRKAFDNFNYKKIALYDDKKIKELLENPGIIRNRLKIHAAIINAQKFMEVQKEFGSFDKYIWSFVQNKPIKNKWKHQKDVPATSLESDALSKDLKKRGFKFVGSTIMYSHMQACGLINDHLTSCFCYK